MATFTPATPAELTELLMGNLAVCVDDDAHPLTKVEERWGLAGPIVNLRNGMPVDCICTAFADTACCRHTAEVRAIVLDTLTALEVAARWPETHAGEPLPVEIRRAYVVAHVLVKPRAHVWPQLHPVHLRRSQVDSEVDAR